MSLPLMSHTESVVHAHPGLYFAGQKAIDPDWERKLWESLRYPKCDRLLAPAGCCRRCSLPNPLPCARAPAGALAYRMQMSWGRAALVRLQRNYLLIVTAVLFSWSVSRSRSPNRSPLPETTVAASSSHAGFRSPLP